MKMFFGEKVRILRERNGITQEELAHRLGYSHKSSICKIEDGSRKVPAYKLPKFAEALNCSLDELINLEPEHMSEVFPSAESIGEGGNFVLKAEALQSILSMLSQMNTKQLIKVEKVIRTLSED